MIEAGKKAYYTKLAIEVDVLSIHGSRAWIVNSYRRDNEKLINLFELYETEELAHKALQKEWNRAIGTHSNRAKNTIELLSKEDCFSDYSIKQLKELQFEISKVLKEHDND